MYSVRSIYACILQRGVAGYTVYVNRVAEITMILCMYVHTYLLHIFELYTYISHGHTEAPSSRSHPKIDD